MKSLPHILQPLISLPVSTQWSLKKLEFEDALYQVDEDNLKLSLTDRIPLKDFADKEITTFIDSGSLYHRQGPICGEKLSKTWLK